jgi:hypothetical protein
MILVYKLKQLLEVSESILNQSLFHSNKGNHSEKSTYAITLAKLID